MMMNSGFNGRGKGFTLVEMAIVIVIFGLLLAALLVPLQAQRSIAFQLETENILRNSKQALLGFAQATGRLPCPATATGVENPVGGGLCAQQVGFLPAATLGIQPADDAGFALDAWNNRIRYAVTIVNANAFTTGGSMSNLGLAALIPDLRVCSAANCIAAASLTNEAVAVIYSLGPTGALAAGGADETENLNAVANVDTIFVSHDIRANDPNGEFDHLVTWLSPYVLYNAMIQAGQLH